MDERFYISPCKHSPYSLDKYLSYDQVNHFCQSYLLKIPASTKPISYKEAVSNPKWVEVMQSEINALQNNHTWKVVTLPKGKVTIGCKWIYKIKYKSTSEIERQRQD